jgi:hypothetical protein
VNAATLQLLLGAKAKTSGHLPTPLGRDGLCLATSRFSGGVKVDTQQLGPIPSWGPELGMLTNLSDRQAVYAAHQAAGASMIWICTFVHYQEAGVAYPDGIAAWNDFTGAAMTDLATLACEIVQVGRFPAVGIQLGGDELGSQWVKDNITFILDTLEHAGPFDVRPYVVLTPTFDTNADGDWSDPGDQWASTNVTLRSAMPDSMPLFNWLPAGWARLGAQNLSPQQLADGEACVDAWCSEVPADVFQTPFNAPWPAILPGSPWDPEHSVYQPRWASDESPWTQYVQIMGRRCRRGLWTPIPGTPYNVPGGNGIGGPDNGQPVTVSADQMHPQTYTEPSSRGETYYRIEEAGTYQWTHGEDVRPALNLIRPGCLAAGADVAS